MKSLLSHLYKRAMASGGSNGWVTVNLSRFIVLPELEEKPPEPFTEDEVNTMWKAWDDGNVFVGYMLLMIYTSMMPGELLACKIDMIDYDRLEIYGCGKKAKKRKDTPIVFPEFIAPVLQELSEKSASKTGMIFGGDENAFYTAHHAATRAIGVRDLNPPAATQRLQRPSKRAWSCLSYSRSCATQKLHRRKDTSTSQPKPRTRPSTNSQSSSL